MEAATVIGLLASIGTGTSMIPQLIKIIKDRKAEDISFLMLSVLAAGLCCWVIYGSMQKDPIIITSNSFSLLMVLLIIFFSIKYK